MTKIDYMAHKPNDKIIIMDLNVKYHPRSPNSVFIRNNKNKRGIYRVV